MNAYSEDLRGKIVEALEEVFSRLKALLCAEPVHVPASFSRLHEQAFPSPTRNDAIW